MAINSRPAPGLYGAGCWHVAICISEMGAAILDPRLSICVPEMGAATGSRTAPKGREFLAQPYAFLKQWWGPPQGLERLPRAGLSQNRHCV